jgi:Ubiquitin carboxyl-terminal hydrolase
MTIDYLQYELFAFVLHCDSKTANTGHYKAYINCATEWCEFDDDRVRTVKPAELTKLANQGYYYCYCRAKESEQRNPATNSTDPIDGVPPPTFHCSLCNADFENFGAKFQHYTGCSGLKQANERVAD